MARARVVVFDNKNLRRVNASMPQVQAAVDAKTAQIGAAAEALFAAHDHPGGHRIEIGKGDIDGTVSLVGPDPLAVEFGHFQGRRDRGKSRRFVKGLYILRRAAGI